MIGIAHRRVIGELVKKHEEACEAHRIGNQERIERLHEMIGACRREIDLHQSELMRIHNGTTPEIKAIEAAIDAACEVAREELSEVSMHDHSPVPLICAVSGLAIFEDDETYGGDFHFILKEAVQPVDFSASFEQQSAPTETNR